MTASPGLADRLRIAERDRDGVRVLTGSGELDLDAAVRICPRVDAARGDGSRRLLIDLTELGSCDASGLRALVGAAEEFVACAGYVAIVPPADPDVARQFAMIVPDERVPLPASVDEGVEQLGRLELPA